MRNLILNLETPAKNILAAMYESKEFSRSFFIANEANYGKMLKDIEPLVINKYISVSRKGKAAILKILKKGKTEILLNLTPKQKIA